MSFYENCSKLQDLEVEEFFSKVTGDRVKAVLGKQHISEEDFLTLLSPTAEGYIEEMAQRVHKQSLSNFGRAILLYTPIYVSNYCVNKCSYCGYNIENEIKRKKLTLEEVEAEAVKIHQTGLRHVMLLTGESRVHSPISYIKDCVQVLKKYFSSITIEIYPLEEEEYKELVEAGVDGLTIYQETYDMDIYDKVHLRGPKKNFKYRVEAPERAARAGIRGLGVGALYGLRDFRWEAFLAGLHAKYIEDNFPHMEMSMSVPRIRPHAGSFEDLQEISDKNMVQILLAFKLFLPRAGINITTRESASLREHLLPLGVTKLSAGVTTAVGGHSNEDAGEKQFEVADDRSVAEIKNMLETKGYCAVFKDWESVV